MSRLNMNPSLSRSVGLYSPQAWTGIVVVTVLLASLPALNLLFPAGHTLHISSFAISLIFLDRQRRAMSAVVSAKLSRDKDGSYHDPESDLENEILDSETKVDGEDPEPDQNSKA